jgi:hypothetical protein
MLRVGEGGARTLLGAHTAELTVDEKVQAVRMVDFYSFICCSRGYDLTSVEATSTFKTIV